jgi:hypothetical protein
MKSVFSLFMAYVDCEAAVDELLQEGFDGEELNVIVDAELAKSYMDVNLERVDIQATDELGEEAMGLGVRLGAERPVRIPRLGTIYAAGKLATILAKTADAEGTVKETLGEFGVPAPTAETYIEGVISGGLLFWIRTSDRRAAKAAEICEVHNGIQVITHGGG